MEYRIIYSAYLSDIEKEVALLMNLGWEVAGGVSYGNGLFLQAVSRKPENRPMLVKPQVKKK